MNIHYAGLMYNDVLDSVEGIAVSFWTQGCPYHCEGCHNPQTWDPNGGLQIDLELLKQGILQGLIADGVERNFSILGGEPLYDGNIQITESLLTSVKLVYPWVKTTVWTGNTYEKIVTDKRFEKVLNNLDYMIDGPFILSKRDITLPLRGSSNQRIIDVKQSLKDGAVKEIDIGSMKDPQMRYRA